MGTVDGDDDDDNDNVKNENNTMSFLFELTFANGGRTELKELRRRLLFTFRRDLVLANINELFL